MQNNKLLEKVEFLLDKSDNVYNVTLNIAMLSKRKKNLEELSSTFSKENTIVETINETFERTLKGENIL
jgi:hypothetical protein